MSRPYTPRLTAEGIYQNPFYYGENPYPSLPNCTCYAWGRFYEIIGERPALQTGNAKDWFPKTVLNGPYKTGDIPALGAVACFGSDDGDGHVAIVEQINSDGTFIVSQSGYYRPIYEYPPDTPSYFTTDTYHIHSMPSQPVYYFQGFIYNPTQSLPFLDIPAWLLFKFNKRRCF